MKKLLAVLTALAVVFGLAIIGCSLFETDADTPIDMSKNGISVDFEGAATKTVNLSGLEKGKKIYLVTVNTNSAIVSSGNTGGVQGSYSEFAGSDTSASRSLLPSSAVVPPGHHPGAFAFNANPPPITPDMLQNRNSSRSASVLPLAYAVNDTKNFWVESTLSSGSFIQKPAKLLAQGKYSNIWVIENWGTTVSRQKAQTLATKFDQIYPLETKILGYEYGGGPGGNGGKDGDTRVQILVYDFHEKSGGNGNTVGFFWGKDFYQYNPSSSQKSNEAEIFYISAPQLNDSEDMVYSTLVHEFQHMINFNVKTVQNSENSEAWYNEMLSMMAEDTISPLIGIEHTNSGHPIPQRISGFLTSYADEGVTLWQDGDAALDSYSYKYAFGAYLTRNYGGAQLLKNVLANDSTNIASIEAALKQTTGDASIDFNYAMEKFAEAFICNQPGDGRVTFNKTVTDIIDGTEYTFTGFDIWAARYVLTEPAGYYCPWGGPTIYTLSSKHNMQPYSVYLQSSNDWITGKLSSVTLKKPANGVKLYLMVR